MPSNSGQYEWNGDEQPRDRRSGKKTRPRKHRDSDFDEVFGRNNLHRSLCEIKKQGGPAPGLDGVSPKDLCPVELGELAGAISAELIANIYEAVPGRKRKIPKGVNSSRTVTVVGILERGIGKVSAETVEPRYRRVRQGAVYGVSGRGVWKQLVAMAKLIESGNTWIVSDDIIRAFDCVPIEAALEAMGRLLTETSSGLPKITPSDRERYLRVVKELMTDGKPSQSRGIPQGSPLSMIVLNVLLHYELDQQLSEREKKFSGRGFRYVDNLFYVGRDPVEGSEYLDCAAALLERIGMKLHREPDRLQNLQSRGAVNVLGHRLTCMRNNVKIDLDSKPWMKLEEALERCHWLPDPPASAQRLINGWINAYGPAFETADTHAHRLCTLAARKGLPQDAAQVAYVMSAAFGRWQEAKNKQGSEEDQGRRQTPQPGVGHRSDAAEHRTVDGSAPF